MLMLLSAPAADGVPPLADPFAVVDDGVFSLFAQNHKIGEVRETLAHDTLTTEVMLARPTGPNTIALIKSKYVRVYNPKDGLLESVTCTTDSPNGRVDGHREGNDMVLNVRMNNAVTQYKVASLRIDDEQVPRRLALTATLGAKAEFTTVDFFTGKTQLRHAVLQSKALRRVGGETLMVYKVSITGDKATDNTTVFVDSHGKDVEVRLKGGMLVYQRMYTPREKEAKNPFTASDGSP